MRRKNTSIEAHTGTFSVALLPGMNVKEPKTQNTIPTELDADLKSWQVARKVFGIEVAEGVQSSKAAQCLELPTTCSRGYYSADSNLRSGTVLIGVGHQVMAKIAKALGVSIEDLLKNL